MSCARSESLKIDFEGIEERSVLLPRITNGVLTAGDGMRWSLLL